MTNLQRCLAQNIKRYRKAQHLTQEQLAERADATTPYIGSIEIGQKFPSLQMIERIAAALGVDSLQLFQAEAVVIVEKDGSVDLAALEKTLIKSVTAAVQQSMADVT